MRKIVIDTSVLIDDVSVWKKFGEGDEIVIPICVLGELDKLKKQWNETGKAARVCVRGLDELSKSGEINVGIKLENGAFLKIDSTYYDLKEDRFRGFGDPNYGDTQILACVVSLAAEFPNDEVSLLSNDINLRMKAKSRGVSASSHDAQVRVSDQHMGYKVIDDPELSLKLEAAEVLMAKDIPENLELGLNEGLAIEFETEDGLEGEVLGRKVSKGKIKLVKKNKVWGIFPRNREQTLAMDMLMDENLDLITLTGLAGSGKSLMVLSAALELVLGRKAYSKLIVFRPIQEVGQGIGYVPGPQPLDAKILTPTGWTTMGELKKGSLVIGRNGYPTEVIDVFPKGKKMVYRLTTTEGKITECCEDHLWLTKTVEEKKRGKPGKIRTTSDILQTMKNNNGRLNHSLPRNEPIQFEKSDLPIPPYSLGAYLGDGCGNVSSRPIITTKDEEIVIRMNGEITDMGCYLTKVVNSLNHSIRSNFNGRDPHSTSRWTNPFKRKLEELGLLGVLAHNKFIPDQYKYAASIEERHALIQGLMDTDGTCQTSGQSLFTTSSERLARDLIEVVRSLGGRTSLTMRNRVGKQSQVKQKNGQFQTITIGRPSYEISVSLPVEMNPFHLSRKANRVHRNLINGDYVKSIEPIGEKEVQCILVADPEHLYITDDYITTHNTVQEKLEPHFLAVMDSLEFLLGKNKDWKKDLEMWKKKGTIEFGAFPFIRGRNITNSIVFLDEAQNISQQDMKTILTRVGEGTKMVLSGDIEQIDRGDLDAENNGLSYVIEKFKNSELAGHITFTEGERSKLATLAAKIL